MSELRRQALKEARDEYVGTQQDIYDEAYRRAKLELDYYEALWADVLADTVDTAVGHGETAIQRRQLQRDKRGRRNHP